MMSNFFFILLHSWKWNTPLQNENNTFCTSICLNTLQEISSQTNSAVNLLSAWKRLLRQIFFLSLSLICRTFLKGIFAIWLNRLGLQYGTVHNFWTIENQSKNGFCFCVFFFWKKGTQSKRILIKCRLKLRIQFDRIWTTFFSTISIQLIKLIRTNNYAYRSVLCCVCTPFAITIIISTRKLIIVFTIWSQRNFIFACMCHRMNNKWLNFVCLATTNTKNKTSYCHPLLLLIQRYRTYVQTLHSLFLFLEEKPLGLDEPWMVGKK